jgi:two-component system NtrC family sensor kinase
MTRRALQLFARMSIRDKMNVIVLVSSVASLILSCVGFVAYDAATFRSSLGRDLAVVCRIMGDNARAPLEFKDATFAQNVLLASLSAHPNITVAALYDAQDKMMATYERSDASGNRTAPAQPGMPGLIYDENHLRFIHEVVKDVHRLGVLFVESDLKALTARWKSYIEIIGLVLAASMIGAWLISSRVQCVISGPVIRLAHAIREVGRSRDYAIRVKTNARDEIGDLFAGFNEMLSQIAFRDQELEQGRTLLECRIRDRTAELTQANASLRAEVNDRKEAEARLRAAQQDLVAASRQAGMAEIATGVLHNVGNVLNSINISVSFIVGRLKNSRTPSLGKVVALLGEHRENLGTFLSKHPKGHQIPAFLDALSIQLLQEQADLMKEMDGLQEHVAHIKHIVATQQAYARIGGVADRVAPHTLMEDALELTTDTLNSHHVEVIQSFAEIPWVVTDRHKVLQILVNLITNACQAVDNRPLDRRIVLRIATGNPGQVRFEVTDNGVGIPNENLAKIFHHGFTTTKQGHGFGLHSAANAARELGGVMSVHSDGPGTGATFTLELPVESSVLHPTPKAA